MSRLCQLCYLQPGHPLPCCHVVCVDCNASANPCPVVEECTGHPIMSIAQARRLVSVLPYLSKLADIVELHCTYPPRLRIESLVETFPGLPVGQADCYACIPHQHHSILLTYNKILRLVTIYDAIHFREWRCVRAASWPPTVRFYKEFIQVEGRAYNMASLQFDMLPPGTPWRTDYRFSFNGREYELPGPIWNARVYRGEASPVTTPEISAAFRRAISKKCELAEEVLECLGAGDETQDINFVLKLKELAVFRVILAKAEHILPEFAKHGAITESTSPEDGSLDEYVIKIRL